MMKKILILSPVPTHPQDAGHKIRIYHLASNLKNLGHDVYFVYFKGRFRDARREMTPLKKYWGKKLVILPYKNFQPKRDKRGLPVGPWDMDIWCSASIRRRLSTLNQKIRPDAVIAEYAAISGALEVFKKPVLKIIDTMDIYTGRDQKLLKHGIPLSGWYSLNAQQERKALSRADIILTIQPEDQKTLAQFSNKKSVTIGHWLDLHPPASKKTPGSRILFVGAGSQISKKSTEYFIDRIFPEILKKIPSAKFYIAGGVCRLLKNYPGCFKLGPVKSLDKAYAAADVVVNSEIFATGLSTKNMVALAHSKPLVTTPAGARGMRDGKGKAFIVADSPKKFADAVLKILKSKQFSRRLSKNAVRYAAQKNNEALRALAALFQ